MQDRNQKIQNVIESLEKDLELLCLTGVEDKLQLNVRNTLETLRNAGVKVILFCQRLFCALFSLEFFFQLLN